MPDYKCKSCDEAFSNEEIQSHLLACATVKIVKEEEKGLEMQLKEKYPFIEKITYLDNEDLEEDYKMQISKADGSSYVVVYLTRDDFTPLEKKEKETSLDIVSRQIDKLENNIRGVITLINQEVDSDIKYKKMVENSGTAGDGLVFSFTVKGEEITKTYYPRRLSSEKFIEEVLAYYKEVIAGELSKFNDTYKVDGVSINEWLRINEGKNIILKIQK